MRRRLWLPHQQRSILKNDGLDLWWPVVEDWRKELADHTYTADGCQASPTASHPHCRRRLIEKRSPVRQKSSNVRLSCAKLEHYMPSILLLNRKKASSMFHPRLSDCGWTHPVHPHCRPLLRRITVRPETVILAMKPSPETVSCNTIRIG